MVVLAQNSYTVKRIEKSKFDVILTPETLAIPATTTGVADLTYAEFDVLVHKEGKEVFPVYDDSLIGRNLFKGYGDEEITLNPYQSTGSFTQFNDKFTFNPSDFIGKEFTVSFYAKSPNGTTSLNIYNTNGNPRYFYFSKILDTALNVEWKYYTYSFVNIDRGDVYAESNKIEIYAPNKTGVLVKKIKIEQNSSSTPWTPAPEEILTKAVINTQNCTASVVGNKLKVSTITPGSKAGYVDLTINYGEGFSQTKRFTWVLTKDAKAITSVDVEFAQSTSNITSPTTGWQTTAPSWIDGRYIWSRTKTTYSDNSISTTLAVCLTGGKGATGKGVSSAAVTYQLHTSGTMAPTGTWTSAIPTPVKGQYLWARTITTYTDNTTSTTYSVSYFPTDGQSGKGIAGTAITYQLHTSGSVAPTGTWLSSVPTPVLGQYLWTRTIVTYTDATTSTSYSTSYYATNGSTGAPGTGIDSITEEYYLSTSKTTQTGGSWLTTPPAWSTGSYIWTRSRIVYKNPASTAYTTPVVSAEWEAVNDIQIGGRNLYLNSEPERTSTREYVFYAITDIIQKFSGQELTYSLDVKVPVAGNVSFYSLGLHTVGFNKSFNLEADVWTRIVATGIASYDAANPSSYCNLSIYGIYDSGRIPIVRKLKIEKGNKATDWTPAPEDVQAGIDAASLAASNAQTSANTANTAVGSLNTYVDGAFKNGVIENSEAKAIEKYINIVNTEKSNLEATYNTLYANSYLEGTAKTNLLNAKVTYFGAVTTLINSINTAIADGKTTVAEKQSVDTNYTSYKTSLASLQTAIENANKAIQDKLKNYSDAAQNTADNASISASDALAKANTSKAITDKFGTTIEGGLIQSVMISLREINSADDTAGFSGIRGQNMDLPAFWTGTYAHALDGTAGIIFRHNSTGKIGVLDIDANGNVKLMDVTDPMLIRLIFSKSNIPGAADILSTTQFGQSVTNAAAMGSTSGMTILANGLSVTKDSSELTFAGILSINAALDEAHGYTSGFALVKAMLYKDDEYYADLSSIGGILDTTYPTTSGTYNLNVKQIVPIGNYTIVLQRTFENTITQSGGISNTSTFAWSFVKDIRRFEFGLDGFMSWYTNNHIHFKELTGLDIQGATNIPGVLLSATVASSGGWAAVWGAKKSTSSPVNNSTGRYTVYHTVGHSNYQVNATPNTSNKSCYIVSKGVNNFVIEWRSIGSTPALINTGFDFQIVGNNYS